MGIAQIRFLRLTERAGIGIPKANRERALFLGGGNRLQWRNPQVG